MILDAVYRAAYPELYGRIIPQKPYPVKYRTRMSNGFGLVSDS
jgi:hypothetical protein